MKRMREVNELWLLFGALLIVAVVVYAGVHLSQNAEKTDLKASITEVAE